MVFKKCFIHIGKKIYNTYLKNLVIKKCSKALNLQSTLRMSEPFLKKYGQITDDSELDVKASYEYVYTCSAGREDYQLCLRIYICRISVPVNYECQRLSALPIRVIGMTPDALQTEWKAVT